MCMGTFLDRVSLCSPGCPGSHSVDHAGLELRDMPVSASTVLGLKACVTTAQLDWHLNLPKTKKTTKRKQTTNAPFAFLFEERDN